MIIIGLAVLFIMVIFLIGIVVYFISLYNGLISVKNNIKKSWANIDVLLKQRHDELTKLMPTVEAYMKHEREVLQRVTEARTAFMNAKTVGDQAGADNMMAGALKSMFAVAENYPDLKANASFLQFQGRISEIENQIADRREFYNDSVNSYNIRIASIPDLLIARMLGYTPEEMFKVADTDKQDVEVKFNFK
ncbi:MAG: LemA family protein [Candidatus Wallbacteria bacterium]|nr:LemA family protein [Candidatus Wallbacteria bacterium]